MFVDEDCVDSRSDVDDLRTRDCLYVESRQDTKVPSVTQSLIVFTELLASHGHNVMRCSSFRCAISQ